MLLHEESCRFARAKNPNEHGEEEKKNPKNDNSFALIAPDHDSLSGHGAFLNWLRVMFAEDDPVRRDPVRRDPDSLLRHAACIWMRG